MVINRPQRTYTQTLPKVKLYQDDLLEIWDALATLPEARVNASVVTRTEGTVDLSERQDFSQLSPERVKAVELTGGGVTVHFSKERADVVAVEPDNAQVGVIARITGHVSDKRNTRALFIGAGLLIPAAGGIALVDRWNDWRDTALTVGLVVVLLGVNFTPILFVPAAVVVNKPRNESFWVRRREDILLRSVFAVVGALLGFVIGKVSG